MMLFPSQVNCAVWVALKLAAYGMLIQLFLKECVLHPLRDQNPIMFLNNSPPLKLFFFKVISDLLAAESNDHVYLFDSR